MSDINEKKSLKQELGDLSKTLNSIDEEKRSLSEQRSQLHSSVAQKIATIRELRSERDALTADVQRLKSERSSLNKKVGELVEKFALSKQECDDFLKKNPRRENPALLKKEHERLSFKLETDVVSFEKEKGVMKVLKALKARIIAAVKSSDVFERLNKVKDELRDARKVANAVHRELQSKARLSQEKHELVLKLSAEVEVLRSKEQELFGKISDVRKSENDVSQEVEEKLEEVVEQKIEDDHRRKQHADRKRQSDRQLLSEKKRFVEEKLAKGEKLNTEDILVLQGAE